jgi:hypothetical protein
MTTIFMFLSWSVHRSSALRGSTLAVCLARRRHSLPASCVSIEFGLPVHPEDGLDAAICHRSRFDGGRSRVLDPRMPKGKS